MTGSCAACDEWDLPCTDHCNEEECRKPVDSTFVWITTGPPEYDVIRVLCDTCWDHTYVQ